jgi:hypothetical protein
VPPQIGQPSDVAANDVRHFEHRTKRPVSLGLFKMECSIRFLPLSFTECKNYPLNTLVQKLGIPQIRARIELQRGHSAKAIEQLRPTEAYQFGYVAAGISVYLRGLSYLQAKQGPLAVAEFQKILDHKSAFGASPHVSLARLGRGFDSLEAEAAQEA